MRPRTSAAKYSGHSIVVTLLSSILACGGSSDPAPVVVPPSSFAEKISNVTISDSLIYFSVEVAEGRFELFSVNPTTGVRNNVSDVFSANNSLRPLAVTTDGSRVGYRADRDNDGVDELYSNLADGSNEVLITNQLESNIPLAQARYNWQWMPDASQIIFRNDMDSDGIFEVQSILPDGTNLQSLSASLSVTCDGSVCWKIASNSSLITFKTESLNLTSQISQNLFSVLPDASGLTQLNQTLSEDSRINNWLFAPGNSLIAYTSQNAGEVSELYTVLADASVRTLINSQSQSLGVLDFAWAPDGSRIAFTDDVLLAGQSSLYTDLADASDPLHMIDTFEVANPILTQWQWSPDSSKLAYMADQETSGVFELFTVQNDAQWHRAMNAPLPLNGVVQNEWQWSPASDFVAFYAEIDLQKSYDELYSSAADGTQVTQVTLPFSSDASIRITNQHWTPNGANIIYSIVDANGVINVLYSVQGDGSNVRQMSNNINPGEAIGDNYLVSPDSSRVLYQVTSADGLTTSLQISSLNSSNRINLATLGVVSQFYWSNDSSRIIYVIKTDDNISQQLFSILPDGTGKVPLY